ncbi:12547_t:CDS:2 [Gigaspora margarita]|uniref:12547_t:CDS:1 n=1 Tax=Gigaspora margarita TaxID=4874 RepID=A0ABN7US45_GIGMA|nr:12547_t:CDS:2 [Gigaspora margarita]
MNKHSNFLPSIDQLQSDVNYKEPLENQDKKTIELQVSQFLCGVTTKNSGRYSRTLLKNALSAINWHLQNVKPGWRYNLHNKDDFPDLYAQFDGLLKDMKKKDLISILGAARGSEHVYLHVLQIVDMPDDIIFRKTQQKNDQAGIEGNQSDLIIPFLSDPEGILEPNSDLRNPNSKWYLDKVLGDRTICSLFKTIYIECGINVESRNISNHSGRRTSIIELFNIGVPENTGHAISGHKSSEALGNILNKLINTTPSNEMAQDLTINTILSNEMAQDSIEQINPESNDNKKSQSIRSEDDELSDADLNNSSQVVRAK